MEKVATSPPRYLRVFTDGSHCEGIAASGRVILGAWDFSEFPCDDGWKYTANLCGSFEGMAAHQNLVLPTWEPLLTAGQYLGSSTIVNAELAAIEMAMKAVSII